jgi:hypothetical protein
MGHQWRPGHQTYRLEPWVEGYSYRAHYSFISSAIMYSDAFSDLMEWHRQQEIEEGRKERQGR